MADKVTFDYSKAKVFISDKRSEADEQAGGRCKGSSCQ